MVNDVNQLDKTEPWKKVGKKYRDTVEHRGASRHEMNLFYNSTRTSIRSYLNWIFPMKNNFQLPQKYTIN